MSVQSDVLDQEVIVALVYDLSSRSRSMTLVVAKQFFNLIIPKSWVFNKFRVIHMLTHSNKAMVSSQP